jgi:putative acetyltransferase
MAIIVRPMQRGEERLFLDMHGRSVRGLASSVYPQNVIDRWAAGTSDAHVRSFRGNADQEVRLIAELDGTPAGLGALVLANNELRACYVVPEAARKGVGTALVSEIERIARDGGLDRLELLASVNAEPFYAALGYHVVERTQHHLRGGVAMDAVRMTKHLGTIGDSAPAPRA